MKLSVQIGKLRLKNPVMTASGTFGTEYGAFMDINRLGAVVLKTITLEERLGNPPPRVAECASGMLNSIGLENKGVEYFIKNKVPEIKKIKTAVIASIAGRDKNEYAALARRLGRVTAIDAIELNLSCPNVKHGALRGLIAQDPAAVSETVSAVRKATRSTIITKLSPNVADIAAIASAAGEAGSDAVLLVNTFQAMAVDIKTRKSRLGNITGGLSGPAVKPMALKMVWDCYNSIGIPIIGCGGIADYRDAVEFMLCGARAVQVGTATFAVPKAAISVIDGMRDYLSGHRIKDVNDLTGNIKTGAL